VRNIFLIALFFGGLSSFALDGQVSFQCYADRIQIYFGDRDAYTFLYSREFGDDGMTKEAPTIEEAQTQAIEAGHKVFQNVHGQNAKADAWSVGSVACRKKFEIVGEKEMNILYSPAAWKGHKPEPALENEVMDVARKGGK
jgi:hypothetical protein